MTTDTPAQAKGFPIHLRDETHRYLTRCGAFVTGVRGRITDQAGQSSCIDCISHGPAEAWVVLPDGTLIERRCSALHEYGHAVAVEQAPRGEQRWVLQYWARGEAEARGLAADVMRIPFSWTRQVLAVHHAGAHRR